MSKANQRPSLSLICILKNIPTNNSMRKQLFPNRILLLQDMIFLNQSYLTTVTCPFFQKYAFYLSNPLLLENMNMTPFCRQGFGLAPLSSPEQQHLFVKICTSSCIGVYLGTPIHGTIHLYFVDLVHLSPVILQEFTTCCLNKLHFLLICDHESSY